MTEPLTHARIGYDHLGLRGTLEASSETAGFPASAANNALTYSFWKPTGLPATFELQLANPEPCDYFGIAAHDLRSTKTVAVMQAFINEAWTTLPVLTKLGEIWTWKDGLEADGGLSHGATFANRRRGYAVDGYPIVNEDGVAESRIGPRSLASEGALSNDVASNVATGTDAEEDTSGFTVAIGGDPVESSTDHAVSGSRSLYVPANHTIEASPIAADALTAYSATLKVWCGEAGQIDVFLSDDVGGIDDKTVDLNPNAWTFIHITGTSAGAATEVFLSWVADIEVWVDEIAVYQGAVPQTWIDTGAEDESNLEYWWDWLQQFAGDITVNCWARVPTGNSGANQVLLNIEDAAGGFLRINLITPDRNLRASVSDGVDTDTLLGGTDWIDGEWHMFTAVVEGTTAALYVDGTLIASYSTAHPPDWATVTKFQVGHDDGANRMTADGKTLLSGLSVVNWAATAEDISDWFSEPPEDMPGLGLARITDDRPIMRLVEETTATRFRVRLVGPGEPTIGVIRMGKALEMMRPIYGGHTPIALARETVIRPNISERGQWLGRSIIRSGARGSWSWQNLTAAWVRRYLEPFIESARTSPFFILWRPQTFPEEAGYCWTAADLSAANAGGQDRMSFSLEAEGLGHE